MRTDDTWIQTYGGRQFWPTAPEIADLDIRDIAHSLSLLCRFNGHCKVFYSVAEHCVRVSRVCSPESALWGLLHDAAEAYIGDFAKPIKEQFPNLAEVEQRLLEKVAEGFGLCWPMPGEVANADEVLLATEARDLMGRPPADWKLKASPLPERIVPMSASEAELAFLSRFSVLTNEPGPPKVRSGDE